LFGTGYKWRGGRFQTGISGLVADLVGVPVIAIASGNDHYLALDNFGNVYS
jgi:alpha-tubulin suppressor-like RCC1 family protein